MQKSKLNVTLDKDLIEFIKFYAADQRASVSDIFTQFILNLRRSHNDEPTEIILSDPQFKEILLDTISRLRSGKIKWKKYREVF